MFVGYRCEQTASTDLRVLAAEEKLPGSAHHQHGPQSTSVAGAQQPPRLISNEPEACP